MRSIHPQPGQQSRRHEGRSQRHAPAARRRPPKRVITKKIYPSVEGIRNVIRLLGMNNEKIRRLRGEALIDDSVVRKLEKDGRF